jgi:hypothetical protein
MADHVLHNRPPMPTLFAQLVNVWRNEWKPSSPIVRRALRPLLSRRRL